MKGAVNHDYFDNAAHTSKHPDKEFIEAVNRSGVEGISFNLGALTCIDIDICKILVSLQCKTPFNITRIVRREAPDNKHFQEPASLSTLDDDGLKIFYYVSGKEC